MKKYNLINNTLGWLCFLISALTYLLTIEPTASFWDCPEFIAQGAKLEIGHPPGNPIFMLTARFFVTIFGGDITKAAVAVNSMSALLSAATILLLFWTITHLVRKILIKDDATEISWQNMLLIMGAGLCGALAYTWSDTFWFSAVEGEVYAFSSFCTALVFWLILKWENHAEEPHSDRYLVLIAYVIGVSIAVHLLNLLCIPAIVLVFYYRKYKNANAKGSLIALGISFVLVALILFGLVPGFVKVAQGFELFFVNTLGCSYNSGVLVYFILLLGVLIYTIYALYANKSPKLIKAGVIATIVLSGITFIGSSILLWIVLLGAAVVYITMFCNPIPRRIFTVGILSLFVIFIGYSSYALILIRATADTPMNQNSPDNVFTLSSYLNREQYGNYPLLYGPVFAESLNIQQVPTSDDKHVDIVLFDEYGPQVVPAETVMRDQDGMAIDNGETKYTKVSKKSPDEPDRYVKESYTPDYSYSPDINMLFTRMYSTDESHINGYKNWSMYNNTDLSGLRYRVSPSKYQEWIDQGYAPMYEIGRYLDNLQPIRTFEGYDQATTYAWKPSFMDNLRYLFNYQLNHMYWRYFMWNFAGRQNDIQGNGEPHLGNWISGIPFIDNARLGDQSLLPAEYSTANKGHNVFYMLPLLLGIIGLLWQSLFYHKNNPKRGIEQFWVVFFLFFMTGVAIVLYLNQPPGQPRERDYAFAGSFYAFAIWIGMGVPAISMLINAFFEALKKPKTPKDSKDKEEVVEVAPDKVVISSSAVLAAVIGLLVPLQMVSQTWDDHDRSHRYTTRDFGENYLNSLDENAIIFTNGDNDTFPLWYAQEVEGKRTDVRVVNLSYLSTDWYANQQLNPYYNADAVKMLAKPTDYAYDKLSYSLSRGTNPERVKALDGLKAFYESAPMDYGKHPIKVLDTPKMYAPVDSAKAMKAFGIDPESVDTITKLPYLGDITMDGLSGSAFTLSKLLSFDIIANSINDGFERPVYIATTVPTSYYLGLTPNLYMTGLAYQVTPFANAPSSPMAEKAYENIVSKFRWGGLDDPKYNKGLYLDETVRRMVATVRNSMIETAESLIYHGDLPATQFAIDWAKANNLPVPQNRYDMARYLLNLMEEKLPSDVTPLDASAEAYTTEYYLRLYSKTGNESDLQHAEAIIDRAIDRYADLARYALALERGSSSYNVESMGYTGSIARYHLPLFIGYKNFLELQKALRKNPEANASDLNLLDVAFGSELRFYTYPLLYLLNESTEDMVHIAQSQDRRRDDFDKGVVLARLHDVAGVDKMKITNDVLSRWGLSVNDLLQLNGSQFLHQR